MTEEIVCVGVDIAKNTLEVAASNSNETRQFDNDDKGITSAVRYIASLKPIKILLEEVWQLRDAPGSLATDQSSASRHRQSSTGA